MGNTHRERVGVCIFEKIERINFLSLETAPFLTEMWYLECNGKQLTRFFTTVLMILPLFPTNVTASAERLLILTRLNCLIVCIYFFCWLVNSECVK